MRLPVRVAILHFTASPAVGGIEALIDAQCGVLGEQGVAVRLIVGRGGEKCRAEVVRIPALHPEHGPVRTALATLSGSLPPPHCPLVTSLRRQISRALTGCSHCIVHNALTVYLNPFLSVALASLVRERSDIGWVAWCSDLSEASRYRPPLTREEEERVRAGSAPTYVTISLARRAQLASLLSISTERIHVIPPPLDLAWVPVGEEARLVVNRLRLDQAEPIALVPAKLLPHKNLELAVQAAAALRAMGAQPRVLISAALSPHEQCASLALADRIRMLGRALGADEAVCLLPETLGHEPDRPTLRDLMLLADLVLLPSFEEGFGMPVLEAAALRAPLLCSDIPPFREIGGDAARYFALDAPPRDVARQMVEIAQEPANRARRQALRSATQFRRQMAALLPCPMD